MGRGRGRDRGDRVNWVSQPGALGSEANPNPNPNPSPNPDLNSNPNGLPARKQVIITALVNSARAPPCWISWSSLSLSTFGIELGVGLVSF